jgi:hypothetical protein
MSPLGLDTKTYLLTVSRNVTLTLTLEVYSYSSTAEQFYSLVRVVNTKGASVKLLIQHFVL